MSGHEPDRQDARPNTNTETEDRRKLFGTGRRAAVAAASIAATAVIGWAVAYYAPGIVSHRAEGPPVFTDVQDDPFTIDTFRNLPIPMMLPASTVSRRTENPPVNWCSGFHGWGRNLGGADVYATHVRLIVQGATDKAVIVTGISARVLKHQPIHGLYVRCPTAGAAQIRALHMNLDSPNPLAVYLVKGSRTPFGFTLRKGETEVFDLTATTHSTEMLEWNLVLYLTVDGQQQKIEIQDRGAPFRTISAQKVSWYAWTGAWTAPGGARRSPFKLAP